jgi:predicted ATPase
MVGRASSPVFVGRDDAIVALRNAVGRSGAGEGSLVLVEGEAGIGKTRLLAEFARSVQDDIAVVAGSCVQLTEGSLPYVPIVETSCPGPSSGRSVRQQVAEGCSSSCATCSQMPPKTDRWWS